MMKTYQETPFESLSRRSEIFLPSLQKVKKPDDEFTLLDIGCGTGTMVAHFAEEFSNATFTGVDISKANIEKAKQVACDRTVFQAADVMELKDISADIVVSDGTLHLVAGKTGDLVQILAQVTRPGGTFMFTMPTDSFGNQVLLLTRRIASVARSKLLDAFMLRVAQMVYSRRKISTSALRDRIEYMYFVPPRLFTEEFHQALEEQGFEHIRTEDDPQRYLLKLNHVLSIWRRK